MYEKIYILDIPITNITRKKAKKAVLKWLDGNETKIVFTPNPEIIMAAQKDRKLKTALKDADMVVPDGIGVVWASKYCKHRLAERVAGYDLVHSIFNSIKDTDKTVYFFGGAPKVAECAENKMIKKYDGLKIVGTHSGYFDDSESNSILNTINSLHPDLLLVGLGFPKQEKWIYDNRHKLNSKVCIGVGGSFDAMAGKVKRAPKIFRKFGLEWFYRLIKQPSRVFRMMQLPLFAVEVIKRAYNI